MSMSDHKIWHHSIFLHCTLACIKSRCRHSPSPGFLPIAGRLGDGGEIFGDMLLTGVKVVSNEVNVTKNSGFVQR
jgi:hypothetical protein